MLHAQLRAFAARTMSQPSQGHIFQDVAFEFSIDSAGRQEYLDLFWSLGVPFCLLAIVAAGVIGVGLRFHINRIATYAYRAPIGSFVGL